MATLIAASEDDTGLVTVELWCDSPDEYQVIIGQRQPCDRLEIAQWIYESVLRNLNANIPVSRLSIEQLERREKARQ